MTAEIPAEIPAHLIDAIAAGRCVAFVGAGFSAPAVPAWSALLEGLREKAVLDADTDCSRGSRSTRS